jgi:hypothetical protein
VARWRNGTEGEALSRYADKVLVRERDLLYKPRRSCRRCRR